MSRDTFEDGRFANLVFDMTVYDRTDPAGNRVAKRVRFEGHRGWQQIQWEGDKATERELALVAMLSHALNELANGEPEEKPQFIHDCESCDFLGRYSDNFQGEARNYDLYYHRDPNVQPDATMGNTVIARYGNEGSEYTSGLVFTNPGPCQLPCLVEAKRRAIAKGLRPDETQTPQATEAIPAADSTPTRSWTVSPRGVR